MMGLLPLSHGDNSSTGVKAQKSQECCSVVECFPGTPRVEVVAQLLERLPGRLAPSMGQKEVIEADHDLADTVESMKPTLLPILSH